MASLNQLICTLELLDLAYKILHTNLKDIANIFVLGADIEPTVAVGYNGLRWDVLG